jgi:hypothetical protein
VIATRRGTGLAEAVVATLITGMVAAAALGGLVSLQRRAAGEIERAALSAGLRTAAHLAFTELVSVDPGAGDLVTMEADRIVYRAVRSTGVVCAVDLDAVRVGSSSFRSLRLPSPGRDSLLLLGTPGGWETRALVADPRAATCPDGSAALALPVEPGSVSPGPYGLRTFEVMELRRYSSGGSWWLGLRSVSGGEGIQPAAGPLSGGGATFLYRDDSGGPAVTPAGTRSVLLRLIGDSKTETGAGAAARGDRPRSDSLELVIALRGGAPP